MRTAQRRDLAAAVLLAALLSACGPAERHAAHDERDAGERKILYYRNPMSPNVTSPVPAKDSMGMDYVPVYADEVAPAVGIGIPGLAAVTVGETGLRLAGVQTVPAVRDSLRRSPRAVGMVTADETRVRHVHTKVSGWIEKLEVNFTGQQVRAGQVILSIYSPQLLATQEELLRAREAARRFADSSLPEVRRGGAELLAAARRRLELFDVPESLLAELERGGEPRRTVELLAPVSGYVTAKGVFEGQEVQPGMELFTLTDLSRVWIEAELYEYEAGLLQPGRKATVLLPYDPAVRREARLTYVYPTLDPGSRTLRVRLELANPDLALKPGMFADVVVELAAAEGVVIPDSALIDTGLRQVVFVESGGGLFEPREVHVAMRSDGLALVAHGLEEGERVVVRANFLLDSESRLRAALAGLTPASSGGAAGHDAHRHEPPEPEHDEHRPADPHQEHRP